MVPQSQWAWAVVQGVVQRGAQPVVQQTGAALPEDGGNDRQLMSQFIIAGALVKPLVEEAKAHETQVLRALGATEKAALRKLLGKLAVSAVSSR